MSEHTPGPWTLHDGEQEWEGDGEPPEREFRWWIGADVQEAFVADVLELHDARLIAAAPALLAALEEIRDNLGVPNEDTSAPVAHCAEVARAAIAKAKSDAEKRMADLEYVEAERQYYDEELEQGSSRRYR